MRLLCFAASLSVATLAGSVLPSAAATIKDFGAFGPNANSYHEYFGDNVSGTFSDDYTFSVNGSGPLKGSITNSFVGTTDQISNFSLSLFSGTPDSGTRLDFVTAPDSDGQSASFSTAVTSGNYYLEVSGTTGSASYGGSLALQVSAVPLPPALPLFGAAILATLGLGYGFKRRESRASHQA